MQRRVSIARALAAKADVYIMDEPFKALTRNALRRVRRNTPPHRGRSAHHGDSRPHRRRVCRYAHPPIDKALKRAFLFFVKLVQLRRRARPYGYARRRKGIIKIVIVSGVASDERIPHCIVVSHPVLPVGIRDFLYPACDTSLRRLARI